MPGTEEPVLRELKYTWSLVQHLFVTLQQYTLSFTPAAIGSTHLNSKTV